MKKTVLIIICAMAALPAYAREIKATTEDGRAVILSENGTWKFSAATVKESPARAITGGTFSKPAAATLETKSAKGGYSLWTDPAKWTLLVKTINQSAEYSLVHTGGDAYAMLITERIPVTLENFEQIVLQNARNAVPNTTVVFSENREVNGKPVRYLVLEGTIQGIPFVYNYYLHSNSKACTQVAVFTSKQLYTEYQQDFQDLLNGFIAE
jgi:hypothetical protein